MCLLLQHKLGGEPDDDSSIACLLQSSFAHARYTILELIPIFCPARFIQVRHQEANMLSRRLVLGSRSPRRLELLRQIVGSDLIDVVVPESAEEAGFENVDDWGDLEKRILDISRTKADDVLRQLRRQTESDSTLKTALVITADTTIVAETSNGKPVVLGQPPESDGWADVVREWFRRYYFGKTHSAVTALCVAELSGQRIERLVKSSVTFRSDGERWLNWYLATGEPRGKAGGYAIQGAGSIFVSKIEGSISNVVGLPLEELMDVLGEFGIDVGNPSE